MTIYVRLDSVETDQIDKIYFRVKQDVRLSKLNLPNVWRLLLQQANNLLEGCFLKNDIEVFLTALQ